MMRLRYKWGSDGCDKEDQGRAYGQVVTFYQMVECYLVGVSGGRAGVVLLLPRVVLWLDLSAGVGNAALEYRQGEDLTISSLMCLLAVLKDRGDC